MNDKKTNSKNREDYEILIRKRGDTEYASYCPQLNLVLKGNEHEQVAMLMENTIDKHIESL